MIKVLPEMVINLSLEMVQFNVFVVHGTTIIKNTQINIIIGTSINRTFSMGFIFVGVLQYCTL